MSVGVGRVEDATVLGAGSHEPRNASSVYSCPREFRKRQGPAGTLTAPCGDISFPRVYDCLPCLFQTTGFLVICHGSREKSLYPQIRQTEQ